MADHRPDPSTKWRRSHPPLPPPRRTTMGSGDHLSPVLFAGLVKKTPPRTGRDNPVHRNPGGWYGLTDGSEA